jgi:hypothetical protein
MIASPRLLDETALVHVGLGFGTTEGPCSTAYGVIPARIVQRLAAKPPEHLETSSPTGLEILEDEGAPRFHLINHGRDLRQ